MSAPLKLTMSEVKSISDAMQVLTTMTQELGIVVEGYSGLILRPADADHGLQVGWSADANEYVVDDRSGD